MSPAQASRGADPGAFLQALSMGVHESQSLLWERMVGLSVPFAEYLTPLLKGAFPQLPAGLTPEQVYGAVNVVKIPSLIRVEADEVQYPLHIMLRYETSKPGRDAEKVVGQGRGKQHCQECHQNTLVWRAGPYQIRTGNLPDCSRLLCR